VLALVESSRVIYIFICCSPKSTDDPWEEIEAELVAVVEEDLEATLPPAVGALKEATVCHENVWVALFVTPDRQTIVQEAEIEDLMPLRSTTMESAAGSSSQAASEDMSLLEDEL
jgi:hypothetical protein